MTGTNGSSTSVLDHREACPKGDKYYFGFICQRPLNFSPLTFSALNFSKMPSGLQQSLPDTTTYNSCSRALYVLYFLPPLFVKSRNWRSIDDRHRNFWNLKINPHGDSNFRIIHILFPRIMRGTSNLPAADECPLCC